MRYEFGDNPQNIHVGEINQIAQGLEPINTHDNAAIKKLCHVLLLWVLDGKKHGNGFGFPFDRPHTEFYRRLRLLWEHLNNLQQKCITNKPIFKCITRVIGDLAPLVNEMQCMTAFQGLTKKQSVFDNLRQALSIALPGTTKGLNDTGEIIADTPLVKNLDNPVYMDVILDGKESLEDAFADISQLEVMRKMQDAKKGGNQNTT